MKAIKKAQNGATKDSTNYYTRKMLSDMDMSFRSSGDLKKTYDSKFNKDVKDLSRQKLKGKTGYDKNGYPIKKNGGSVKAKDGKWIQKAINPAHKGYCTPMTKATCTPKRKALAKTLRKISKKK